MEIVPNPAKPRPRPDDELCAGSLLTSRVSSETQSTWVTMPHRWHRPPSILRDLAPPQHRRRLPQVPAPYAGEQSNPVLVFGAHLHSPSTQACRGASLAQHDRRACPPSRPCPCSTGLSLTISSLPGWLVVLFQVPVRHARWGLPNIPTPSSQPLLGSTLNVEIRLCQCFPAICSIHSAPSFACFRSSVPTLS